MSKELPGLCSRGVVQQRLEEVFPEGTPYRTYLIREMAAATVFSMLYVGAVEGTDRYLGPKHVYRMSDEQASLLSDAQRLAYAVEVRKPGFVPRGTGWYADNTRESIRDETIRQGLIPLGAAIDRRDLPTTSSKPRYALSESFARLFDPALSDLAFKKAAASWRKHYLSPAALARVTLVRSGRASTGERVEVRLPSGDTRTMVPGPSSVITKAVVEEFAARFLEEPALLWVSESGNKVVEQDDLLARSLNLTIDPARHLPDVILADVASTEVVLVFVEVVATDGPVSEARRTDLLELATAAGIPENKVAFVSAYLDRNSPPLRKNFADLAWGSFV